MPREEWAPQRTGEENDPAVADAGRAEHREAVFGQTCPIETAVDVPVGGSRDTALASSGGSSLQQVHDEASNQRGKGDGTIHKRVESRTVYGFQPEQDAPCQAHLVSNFVLEGNAESVHERVHAVIQVMLGFGPGRNSFQKLLLPGPEIREFGKGHLGAVNLGERSSDVDVGQR